MEKIIKPFEKLRGGINFLGALAETDALNGKASWIFQKKYYEAVKNQGFNHIRLLVCFQNYSNENGTLNLELIAEAVNNALQSGLMVVLCFYRSCYKEKEKFLKIWEQVAAYFKDYPEELMFELVNGPCGTSDEYLNEVQLAAVETVRKTNPTRGIALAPNQGNGTWKMLAVEWPQNDQNCFLSVHNYYMEEFTRQGLPWGETRRAGYVEFSTYVANQIKEHLDFCGDYQMLYGKTVWISECGVCLKEAHASEASKYVEHITKKCATFKLPYAYWEFNQDFGLFDMENDEWKKDIMGNITTNW